MNGERLRSLFISNPDQTLTPDQVRFAEIIGMAGMVVGGGSLALLSPLIGMDYMRDPTPANVLSVYAKAAVLGVINFSLFCLSVEIHTEASSRRRMSNGQY